ncbi:unnamed protein product [Meloidogyne enterolobii]|uniref:Uncharacterized protein n=1 Tax=Meloidogyne enterolobii TaxID=390850 RepID=A0ACB0ZIC4_MELEN
MRVSLSTWYSALYCCLSRASWCFLLFLAACSWPGVSCYDVGASNEGNKGIWALLILALVLVGSVMFFGGTKAKRNREMASKTYRDPPPEKTRKKKPQVKGGGGGKEGGGKEGGGKDGGGKDGGGKDGGGKD